MASLNRVFILGNLTHNPEIRYTTSGTAVAHFTVAVNRRYKDSTGELQGEVCFVEVSAWNKLAEICNDYLSKGKPVLIEGRLNQRQWEQEGQKRSKLEVVALNIQFLGALWQGKGEKEEIDTFTETEDDLLF